MAVITPEVNPRALFAEFNLPQPTLKQLSIGSQRPRDLQMWLDGLPVIQTRQVSALLYKLLPDINHLDINGRQRLALMEVLRPFVNQCIERLAADFLKHPLSLSATTTKTAAIAQALQRHLCDGYLITAKQLAQGETLPDGDRPALALALYYSLHGLGQFLYRCYQLYVPPPPGVWKKLHQTYLAAKYFELGADAIPDSLLRSRKSLSCEQTYYRCLIMASSQTNQLRELDIGNLYHASEEWAAMVQLIPARKAEASLYWVNLEADSGPFYGFRHQGLPSSYLYGIDYQHLLDLLQSHKQQPENPGVIAIPTHIRQSLFQHLLTCWQEPLKRQFPRQPAHLELEICIGLKAAHDRLLHGRSFADFIGDDNNSDYNNSDNGIEANFDALDGLTTSGERADKPSPVEPVIATDISDHGYCLQWTGPAPIPIKTGEIILLRTPGATDWQAGTVRWAQRLNHHTYIGVQVLAGYAEASAASTRLQNGTITPFLRTLLLHSADSDDVSLLMPTIPFCVKQQVDLQQHQSRHEIELTHLLLSSSAINQYRYRLV